MISGSCLLLLVACQSRGDHPPRTSLEKAMERSALITPKPRYNIRRLRSMLMGKNMRTVMKLLGQPSQVFTTEDRESWSYQNVAFDPVTHRVVHLLEISFADKVVQDINFSY